MWYRISMYFAVIPQSADLDFLFLFLFLKVGVDIERGLQKVL